MFVADSRAPAPSRAIVERTGRGGALACFLLASLMVSCRQQAPVGSLELQPAKLELGQGRCAKVRFVWRPEAPLRSVAVQPIVFVHLLDATNEVVRTFDHEFPGDWRVGKTIEYERNVYHSAFGFALPPGSYRLAAGLYDGGDRRWPLRSRGSEVGHYEYELASVEVPSTPPAPQFEFSASWEPVEAGTDRQILGRRWLRGQGSIDVRGLREPGTLWMVLDASVPTTVETHCGDASVPIPTGGRREIELLLAAAGECEIHLRPDDPEMAGDKKRRNVRLEILAFLPGAH